MPRFLVDPLTSHCATWLLRWARAQFGGADADRSVGPPPAALRNVQPTTVILTVYDRKGGLTFTGRGGSLLDAVMSAVAGALLHAKSARRLQLDIVQGDPV